MHPASYNKERLVLALQVLNREITGAEMAEQLGVHPSRAYQIVEDVRRSAPGRPQADDGRRVSRWVFSEDRRNWPAPNTPQSFYEREMRPDMEP